MPSLLGAAIAAFLAASLCGWAALIRRWRRRQAVLLREPRPDTPWGLSDVLLTLAALGLTQAWVVTQVRGALPLAATQGFDEWSVNARATLLLNTSLTTLLAVLVSIAWLVARYRVTAAALGLRTGPLARDVALGCKAFVLVAPPVYGLQGVLAQFFESKHPLLELLKDDPSPRFFAISALTAVLIAPVVEEYLFRVLLQSWLERFALRHRLVNILWGGRAAETERTAHQEALSGGIPTLPGNGTAGDGVGRDVSLLAPPVRTGAPLAQSTQSAAQPMPPPLDESPPDFSPVGPILISSATFAVMHWSHGPDPAALFLLAVALGTLYARTRRVAPCIVAHALLNAASLVSLWIAVHQDA